MSDSRVSCCWSASAAATRSSVRWVTRCTEIAIVQEGAGQVDRGGVHQGDGMYRREMCTLQTSVHYDPSTRPTFFLSETMCSFPFVGSGRGDVQQGDGRVYRNASCTAVLFPYRSILRLLTRPVTLHLTGAGRADGRDVPEGDGRVHCHLRHHGRHGGPGADGPPLPVAAQAARRAAGGAWRFSRMILSGFRVRSAPTA